MKNPLKCEHPLTRTKFPVPICIFYIMKRPEIWTPPNVNKVSRSYLYLSHYEKTFEMWTSQLWTQFSRSHLYVLHYEKTSEIWTPSNVNKISRSYLYLSHYEKTYGTWTPKLWTKSPGRMYIFYIMKRPVRCEHLLMWTPLLLFQGVHIYKVSM